MDQTNEVPVDVRALFASTDDSEAILSELRARGYTIAKSIFFFAVMRKMGLGNAKKLAHESVTWSDMREYHDRYHDAVEEAVRKIQKTEEEGRDLESLE
ncbi:MAG: hypothetical protein JST22_03150 [Bacteroidetes bacterium]|nr:hypothetical protein [Bacteroidota bacterium]